jgi:predicted Zn-dependent protease
VSGGAARARQVNGLSAASAEFAAQTEGGVLRGSITAIEYGDNVYQFLGFAPDDRWGTYREAVRRSVESFRELNDPEALGVQPLRLEIVRLDRSMTLAQFAQRYPSQVSLDELALLNRAEAATTFPAGHTVKRVVGGPVP